jgi:hypothetical protein
MQGLYMDTCLTVSQWLSLDWVFYPFAIALGFAFGVYATKALEAEKKHLSCDFIAKARK